MKRILLLSLILIMFSIAHARSLDISIDKSKVPANSQITISYSINLDEKETFSYQVGIKGENQTIILLNKTLTDNGASGEITWDTKNYPAGEYEAFIFISPSTYWPSSKFTILPYMDFQVSKKVVNLFVYEKSATAALEIKNIGNVPLFVSASPKGLRSEASIVPITSNIPVNQSAKFLISVEKPENHYNATITFEISWENSTSTVEVPLHVYNPKVVIEAENISLTKEKEDWVVTGIIYNRGNVDRNLTLLFGTSSGEKVYNVTLKTNKSMNLNYTFPLDSKVSYLEIKYIGSDGKEKTIKKTFSPLASLPTFGEIGGKYIYIFGLILLLILIYGFLKLRKKKEEKIDLEKLNRTLGK